MCLKSYRYSDWKCLNELGFNFKDAPNDEIAYHIRKSRGLHQPWRAEQKFGPSSEAEEQKSDSKSVQFDFDPNESLETAFLGFVSRSDLEDKVRSGWLMWRQNFEA